MAQGLTLINYILSLPFFLAFLLFLETGTFFSLKLKVNKANLLYEVPILTICRMTFSLEFGLAIKLCKTMFSSSSLLSNIEAWCCNIDSGVAAATINSLSPSNLCPSESKMILENSSTFFEKRGTLSDSKSLKRPSSSEKSWSLEVATCPLPLTGVGRYCTFFLGVLKVDPIVMAY